MHLRILHALKAFQQRKAGGMNLSQRVWNLSEQYKTELEMALSAAIEPGTSAMELAADIKTYLNEPDKMFRRFRYKDEEGNWQRKWKQKVTDANGKVHFIDADPKAYHPGRGVYRSSARNAQRLARTEINMAYRKAEQERWKSFDFVVGYEVKVTKSEKHVEDICDCLKGKYRKDFKFMGWHPMCMCYTIPILKTEDEFFDDDEDAKSVNEVEDVPQGFKDWIKDNEERIDKAEKRGTVPYFIADNRDTVKRILEGGGGINKSKEDAKENEEVNQQSTRNPLTEQQKQRRAEIKNIMTSKESNVYASSLFDSPISLPNKSIKEWLNQPHYAVDEKNESLLNLQSILDGCDKKIEIPIKPKYQESVSAAYALPIKIKERESWIIIHVMKWGEIKIHGISDDAGIFNK